MLRYAWIAVFLGLGGCPADDAMSTAEDGPENTSQDSDSATTDAAPALGCAAEIEHDTTDGAANDLQQTWGSACSSNEDCVPALGEGAECLFSAAGTYALPLGYCSKPCTLSDDETHRLDSPDCDPAGGIACIGSNIVQFAYCAAPCTDDNQCSRDGYTCRLMPQISPETDPNFCLMPDCCLGDC